MAAPVIAMTPEEFLDFEHSSLYELIDGCLVERNGSYNSAKVTSRIFLEVAQYNRQSSVGLVFDSDLGVRIFHNPRDVRKADVLFIKAERAPNEESGYLEIAPDLVIEVNSPNDKAYDIRAKVESWLGAGVGTVWVAAPVAREVTVYRRGETPIVFPAESEISGGDALPGFVCKVANFFP